MVFLTFLTTILALYIRLKLVFLNFWHDEVYTVMAAKGIIDFGIPKMPSGLIYSRAFPFSYLTSLSINIFGNSELSVRFPAILISIISIFVFYKLLSKISNVWVGLLGSLILVFSPWHIIYSFFARSYLLQAFLFFLTGWFYYLFLKNNKSKYLYYSLPVILLNSLLSTVAFLNVFFLAIVIFLLALENKKNKIKNNFLIFILHFIVSFVSLLIPGAIPAWSSTYSSNPYFIYEIKKFILPNLFFFKTLFKFFPIGSVILLISLPYFWFKDRKFIIFPLFIFLSFIFLSIINPFGNLQPRYLSYFMFVYYFSVFYFLYKLFKKNIFILIITFFLVSDVYQFPKMINLTYGNKLPKTAVVSLSWIEFHDIKSQVEYVNNNYKKGDVIISLQPKGQTEVYLKPKLDYILRTKNYINEGHMEKDIFVDDYSKIPIITTVGELERIISLSDRIWLISSSSETLEVEHIDKATYNLLLKLANKVVYRGKEVNSKIYLINEKK